MTSTEAIYKEYLGSKNKTYKSITVEKLIGVKYDLGNLMCDDPNDLDEDKLKSSQKDTYLKNLTRDNTQLLINKIWELPTDKVDMTVVVKLPEGITRLPREKPLPNKKAQTKWEKFAETKSIKNKKKGRMVWDDELRKYVPKWGYKGKEVKAKSWMMEVPDNADAYEDQFEKVANEKKDRIAKNEFQRLRNIAKNSKGKVPGIGLMPTKSQGEKEELRLQLQAARTSTASMGKFDAKLKQDKEATKTGKKRKFESNSLSVKKEQDKQLSILASLKADKPIVNLEKAAKNDMAAKQADRMVEEEERERRPKTQKKQKGTSKHSKNKNKK